LALNEPESLPIVWTRHARQRMLERGVSEQDAIEAIRNGEREAAQRGLVLCRLNLEFRREWDGRHYAIQQVAPVIAVEPDRIVVVTVYAFYF
jgi:hypothetical protein